MNQIEQMFALQKQLNDETNGEIWIEGITKENRKISWYRGIYMEVAEAIDSFNWKHWKNINDEPIGIISKLNWLIYGILLCLNPFELKIKPMQISILG